jgi:hypothetical protein
VTGAKACVAVETADAAALVAGAVAAGSGVDAAAVVAGARDLVAADTVGAVTPVTGARA